MQSHHGNHRKVNHANLTSAPSIAFFFAKIAQGVSGIFRHTSRLAAQLAIAAERKLVPDGWLLLGG